MRPVLPESFYPKETSEWIALIAACIPLIALCGSAASFAIAAFWRALTHRQERKEHDWKRLHALIEILNNKEGQHYIWTQISAVREMETLNLAKPAARSIARKALRYWKEQNANPEMIKELERFIAVSHPFFVVRFYRRLLNP